MSASLENNPQTKYSNRFVFQPALAKRDELGESEEKEMKNYASSLPGARPAKKTRGEERI